MRCVAITGQIIDKNATANIMKLQSNETIQKQGGQRYEDKENRGTGSWNDIF